MISVIVDTTVLEMDAIAIELNERPRKVLNFLTPAELFQRDILQS